MSPLTVTDAKGFNSYHDDMCEVPALSSPLCHDTLHYEKNLPAPEIHRRALAARRLQGKAHHLLSQWLLDMEERGLFREFGCSSVFMYAELHLHLEGHTVAEYLRAGKALKHFPLLAEAYEQGALSASKLREITRVVTKESCRGGFETRPYDCPHPFYPADREDGGLLSAACHCTCVGEKSRIPGNSTSPGPAARS